MSLAEGKKIFLLFLAHKAGIIVVINVSIGIAVQPVLFLQVALLAALANPLKVAVVRLAVGKVIAGPRDNVFTLELGGLAEEENQWCLLEQHGSLHMLSQYLCQVLSQMLQDLVSPHVHHRVALGCLLVAHGLKCCIAVDIKVLVEGGATGHNSLSFAARCNLRSRRI